MSHGFKVSAGQVSRPQVSSPEPKVIANAEEIARRNMRISFYYPMVGYEAKKASDVDPARIGLAIPLAFAMLVLELRQSAIAL